MNKQIYQQNYANLMLQAEQAGSRKDAKELINLATKLREQEQINRVRSLTDY